MGCTHGLISTVQEENEFEDTKDQCYEGGTLFTDPSFPLITEIILDEKTKIENVKWLRPKEICALELEGTLPKFIDEEPTRFDIKQGELGDCWFLSSIAIMAEHPDCFEHVVPSDNGEFDSEDYSGIFHFRFWDYGRWADVIIDDYLPTRDGKLLFVHSENSTVFWSALLEKAFAKFHGSYAKINGGFEAESFEYLTGGIGECYRIGNASESLFYQIQIYLERNYLISCAIDSLDNKEASSALLNKVGLVDGHAYSLTGAKSISEEVLLVRVRNPWGTNTEWTGAWSDASKEWNTISEEGREEMELTFDADGEFWMRWQDFLKYFYKIDIGFLNPFSFYRAEDKLEKPSVYMLTINGKWSEQNIVVSSDINSDISNKENDPQGVNEDKGEGEFTKFYEEGLQKLDEHEEPPPPYESSDNVVSNENGDLQIEDKDEIEESNTIDSKYLEKCPQYILTVTKQDTMDERDNSKLVICLMVKNRREHIINGDFEASGLKIYLYKTEVQESSSENNLTTEFFENSVPLQGTYGVNYAEESIFGLDIPVGDYCLVLSSEKEAEFFVRIFSDNSDVTIRALTSEDEEEHELGNIWSLIFS